MSLKYTVFSEQGLDGNGCQGASDHPLMGERHYLYLIAKKALSSIRKKGRREETIGGDDDFGAPSHILHSCEAISLVKMSNVREAMKVAGMARDILGARGIFADHHVILQPCDLEAISTLEGTESVHNLILGQDLTEIPAFS